MVDTAHFYNQWTHKLLADYAQANPRAEAAIRFALRYIPPDTSTLLDLGCGLGWSSYCFARHLSQGKVWGIEGSPTLVKTAQHLFPHPRLQLVQASLPPTRALPPMPKADVVVMLDILEHIPQAQRPQLYAWLNTQLSEGGCMLISCPSAIHQAWLRQHRPQGLQPVDEVIDEAVLEEMAAALSAQLQFVAYQHIWQADDYLHACISRKPLKPQASPVLSGIRERQQHLARWYQSQNPRVAVVSPHWQAYSETFIQTQVNGLSGGIHPLYGGHLPTHSSWAGALAHSPSIGQRLLRKLLVKLKWLPNEPETVRAVRRYLQKHRIQVVLAQYGPTGAALLPLCQQLGIPLVVHFHGYDAFTEDILHQNQAQYAQLWLGACKIIVVSKPMQAQLERLGAPKQKLCYNPYGVLPSFAQVIPDYGSPIFLAIGRFVEKKAPYLTLWAFRLVYERVPDARLVFLGDGSLRPMCEHLAAQWGLSEAVRFEGVAAHWQVAAWMARSFCVVQHSITAHHNDQEGMPVALLEAGAAALPVVATNTAGIPEAVIDGKTGFLVTPHDAEVMAEKMLLLYQNRTLAQTMGHAARQHIQTHYTLQMHLERLQSILEEAAALGKVS
ncbi:glycosyltransferase [Eisenibacter elegans]|uniref:glycosyltransferase n=1 Tax=Eisenibacter elegans TaxID=997 RepID=UPI000401D967|nr:glycosyltransferase [Eisenibacter elegans]